MGNWLAEDLLNEEALRRVLREELGKYAVSSKKT